MAPISLPVASCQKCAFWGVATRLKLGVSDDDYDDDTKDFQGRCWRRRAYGGDGPMAEDSPIKCEKLGLSLFGQCVCVCVWKP